MNYEPVIGLEVHAQMLTASKIFCGCATRFGDAPNDNTCPVCMGFPGVLPVLNKRVVEFAIRLGLATHCEISRRSRFARKNYFYPDLPKGYQISQYELPVCEHGYLEIGAGEGKKKIRLTRIHMEEDAGKNIHEARGDYSLVDLNRTGVPLLEIVSEPDIRSSAEAGNYLRNLRAIVQYLEVCDGNMEEGSFRCDANVSVRPVGAQELGTKVEIKNLNSFKAVEKAIDSEIERQIHTLSEGGKLVQETRLWDAEREVTRSMRSKEFAHDYRYFPDPDLLPLVVDDKWIAEIESSLPELPAAREQRFVNQYGLPRYDAEVLTGRRDVADYFETAVKLHGNPKAISNWVMGDLFRVIKERKLDEALRIREWPVPAEHLAAMIKMIDEGKISGKIAKSVFSEMLASGAAPETIVREKGLEQVSDTASIEAAVDQVIAGNPKVVADYRGGNEKSFGFFVGQVMKATQGKASPQIVNEILRRKLAAQ
ncbi:MAG TPA: Asp-tRNA(Asn)/Glu-tRNA(Gln) amidotransferase subunit GatB [Verrucomicrobiae bacterium]|jgi:aspartyl-tRNA(Asn)/glutamyl-tRNA(Gln) amidotransferase subunit B|nr:Asp-tRNA(Asn)/Glu-tRNA(Gln) amidotransferase subunit GatB [Verrucomicrobiae bacterium]